MNRNQLKYLVIVTMLIDHIAWTFVPDTTFTGQMMHFVGRLTGPTMAFFIAEGYTHTRDVRRYATRLAIFAFISWPAYDLLFFGYWPTWPQSVLFTLLLGLLAIWIWDKAPLPTPVRALAIVTLTALSIIGDWPILAVIWPFFLFIFRERPQLRWGIFTAIIVLDVAVSLTGGFAYSWYALGELLVPPLLIWGYNGQSGSKAPFHKWFFYVFYPGHMLVLLVVKLASTGSLPWM